jgi:hypothetical protein
MSTHCFRLFIQLRLFIQRTIPLLAFLFLPVSGFAQGTAFYYNGRLIDGTAPANGDYDITFTIYDAVSNGTASSSSITHLAVGVTNGLFGVSLDFGAGVFNGDPRWLELTVRTNGNGSFTTLVPRQHVKPAPYAILAESARNFTGALGTTTAQPLDLQVNNQRALRLQGDGANPPTVIGGSENNVVDTTTKGNFIGSGDGNTVAEGADFTVIGGGLANRILTNSQFSVIGGGYYNMISNSAQNTVIGGGQNNIILGGGSSTIGGGWGNRLFGAAATIAGGSANVAEGDRSTVAGGTSNQARAEITSVGGGSGNVIDGAIGATISGGNGNMVMLNSGGAAVGGGFENTITNAAFSTISGGQNNQIRPNGFYSVISGGLGNVADANYSSILGGEGNITEGGGGYPTVLGGRYNKASGVASVAAGYRASATNNGSFVWNGWNGTEATFGSLADGEFAVNAPGGVRFFTGTGSFTVNGIDLSSGGVPDSSVTTIKLADGAVTVPKLSINGAAGEGKVLSYSGGSLTWTDASAVSGGWSLNGNAGTTVNNFLGTTDNQPLQFRVNNQRGLRLEESGGIINVIGGYAGNNVAAAILGATIGGGGSLGNVNQVEANYGTVAGGVANTVKASAVYATIGGGYFNTIQTNNPGATIGGGIFNTIHTNNSNATIGGGNANAIQANAANSTISGGRNNQIQNSSTNSVISGGFENVIYANSPFSVIAGGQVNAIVNTSSNSVIGGGKGNNVWADYAVIGGGWINTVMADASVVAGGEANSIDQSAVYGTIGGGLQNLIRTNSVGASIGGGVLNIIQTNSGSATISGGYVNSILTNAEGSVIAGGTGNTIQDDAGYAVIGGGVWNTNTGYGATIPGGARNLAASYSFAAGYRANATNYGAFVWSDGTGTDTPSFADYSVTFRASGGYRFLTDTGTSGAQLLAGQTSWSALSDKNVKKNIQPVDSQAVLAKLAAIPIAHWQYNWEENGETPNIGPMAQDFKAAFFPGRDDKSISTLEFDGVELAAIQGLNQKLEEKVKAKEARIATLEQRLADLELLVKALAEKK